MLVSDFTMLENDDFPDRKEQRRRSLNRKRLRHKEFDEPRPKRIKPRDFSIDGDLIDQYPKIKGLNR